MKNLMIKNRTPLKWLFPLSIIMVLVSCENLEVETPKHLLKGENVFSDSKTVEAAVNSLYANLRDNVLLTGASNGISNLMANYTDEIEYVSAYSLPGEQFYKNNLAASNETVNDIWVACYQQIYGANAILEGIANSKHLEPEERDRFIGEALFIRALIHFYLLNLYGDIPYVTTTNYQINKSVSRQSGNEVYALIIKDLLKARDLLSTTDSSGFHLRPNKYVVLALLARTYLYREQWELSETNATQVIENNGWEPEIPNVFSNASQSTLWQFAPNNEGDPTHEAETFLVLYPPPSEGVLNAKLLAVFEDNDLRKQNWISEISDGTDTWYFPSKYKIGLGGYNTQEYSIVFRMAEQFLIRAEARARRGDISGAQSDLNKIRFRAGLSATLATSQNKLLAAILEERQRELFTEQGHRFFDLKRTANLNAELSYKPGWNNTDRLLPLPERELLVNPNLQPQNPGY